MQLLAYFDNQDIWYELLLPGRDCKLSWLSDVVRNEIRFNRAMAKLHDYSLIDIRPGSYSMHACLHDWALGFLNRNLNSALHRVALHCVGQNVLEQSSPGSHMGNRRLLQHAIRLQSGRLKSMMDSNMVNMQDLRHIAILHHSLDELNKAEPMFLRILLMAEQIESMRSEENILRLETLQNLGAIYIFQGRLAEAEELLLSGLAGREKLYGREYETTLRVFRGLGLFYSAQGKMAEAEKILLQALAGFEQICGSEQFETLITEYFLGRCYMDQGKMAGAESMFLQALTGLEKVCGLEHEWTLYTVWLLAKLYARQEKIAKAVEMYQRAIEGMEKVFGPEQTRTLDVVHDLGWAYWKQGKLVEAEQMYLRVWAGYEKTLGPDHKLTLNTAHGLEILQNQKEEYDRVSSSPAA